VFVVIGAYIAAWFVWKDSAEAPKFIGGKVFEKSDL